MTGSLKETIDKIEKRHGKGSVMRLGDRKTLNVEVIPTGCLALDIALGVGGVPRGRIIEIFGPEGCLHEDTFIQYTLWTVNGERRNGKGGTVKRLWERFHNHPPSGDGRGKSGTLPPGIDFTAPSINEDGRIFHNRIVDVFKTGIKKCYRVTTNGGCEIVVTGDHRFYTGTKYVKLNDLVVGNTIAMHTNTPFRKEKQIRKWRRELYVKNHPFTTSKTDRMHAMCAQNNLRFVAGEDTISSIEYAGKHETFDIRMESPFNNYVANKFVTHNSGKTTITQIIAAQAQKLGGNVAFVDAEHALDPAYARALGVDVDNLYIAQPDCGEQALEIAHDLIESGNFDVVIIDSVAALVPRAEIEGEMGDMHIGLQARLMSQAMRKLASKVHNTNTCLIFTNQIRMKIGVMFGSPETTTGGNALKFYASIRMDIRRSTALKDGDDVYGCRTKIKVIKNKVASPFKVCEFDLIYGKGPSRVGDICDIGTAVGVIEKSGAWYEIDSERFQGKNAVRTYLEGHPETMERVEKAILAHYRINPTGKKK